LTPNSFDERAASWDDDPAKRDRARQAAGAISAAVPLVPTTRLLEYGAGTGLVSEALRPFVGPITLADTSAGMRDVLARKITAGALAGARVWDVDLATDSPPDDEFDLIVTVMALHHVGDIGIVLSRFTELLTPGGRLCVVDLEAEDGSFHGEDFHGHHGFDTGELAAALTAAGFADVSVERCGEMTRHDRTYPLFLATAAAS
jgi:predicted TPR repeat methyltransferase